MSEVIETETTEQQTDQEASDALRAGYNKAAGVKEEGEPVVAQDAPEAAPVTEPAPAETPDPWAGVPPVMRKWMEDTNGRLGSIDALRNDFKAQIGRIGSLQKEVEVAKKAALTVKNAPTPEEIEAAAASERGLADLKEFNPDWAAAIENIEKRALNAIETKLVALRSEAPVVDADTLRREVGESVNKSKAEVLRLARQYARVDQKYPSWDDDVHIYAPDGAQGLRPEFAAWMKAQPPEVQALAGSDLAHDAIKMLDLYYDHRKALATKEKNNARLAASVQPKQVASGGPTVLPDEAGLAIGYKKVRRA